VEHGAPHIIEKVKSSETETTYNPAPNQCRAVTTTAAASTVTDVLAGVATNGTAKPAQLPDGRPIAAKTGTADNVSAAWLAGYTPQAATVVWTGDPVSPLNGLYDVMGLPKVYGGTLPTDLWRETMGFARQTGLTRFGP
jgi:membrane peptidoglycan carboxypeptidase